MRRSLALGEALAEVDRFAQLALVRLRRAPRDAASSALVAERSTSSRARGSTRRSTICRRASASPIAPAEHVRRLRRSVRRVRAPVRSCRASASRAGWRSAGCASTDSSRRILVLYETRKLFGTRTSERFAPGVALFELAYLRFLEREAREEAVRTLEDVTQRVHGEYERQARRRSSSSSLEATGPQALQADPERARRARARGWRRRTKTRAAANRRADAVEAHGERRPSSSSRRRTSSCIGAASRCGRRRARSI